jgi:EPS-associated MarR family transcriptional regulator
MSSKATVQEEIQLQVLRLLQDNPEHSQRTIAKVLGVSLGSINFCFQALAEKGWVKLHNFSQSSHKLGYVYLLTPSGVAQKSRLAASFLKRKLAEYEALRQEIEMLKSELSAVPEISQ